MQEAATNTQARSTPAPHTLQYHQPHSPYALELLRQPNELVDAQPVLFLHGIFVGAWCWQHYLPDFAQNNWDAWALSFRGHGNSHRHGMFGLNDFVADAEYAVDYIEQQTGKKPIVVGHSMGGMVLQRLMMSRRLQAAVLLCSIPPQGLTPLAWSNWFLRPLDMMHMAELIQQGNRVSAEQLRIGMFAQSVNPMLLAQYASQAVSESPFLWSELAQGSMLTPMWKPCPVMVLGTKLDRLVPSNITELTALSYQVKVQWLEQVGHGLMLEQDWQPAALQLREAMHPLKAA